MIGAVGYRLLLLETQHGDKLVARLAGVGDVTDVPEGPFLRVIEFTRRGAALNWGAIARLRAKALGALDYLAERLEEFPHACVDVTNAPRPITATGAALAASLAVEAHVILVEAFAPALTGAWRGLLEDGSVSVTDREIRRRQPLAPKTTESEAIAALRREHPDVLLDSESAGRLISGNPEHNSPKVPAARARKARKIYGIWDGANAYLYPAFQFDSDGKLRPEAATMAVALANGAPPAAWWFVAHDELDGASPAECFADEPGRVTALAAQEAVR